MQTRLPNLCQIKMSPGLFSVRSMPGAGRHHRPLPVQWPRPHVSPAHTSANLELLHLGVIHAQRRVGEAHAGFFSLLCPAAPSARCVRFLPPPPPLHSTLGKCVESCKKAIRAPRKEACFVCLRLLPDIGVPACIRAGALQNHAYRLFPSRLSAVPPLGSRAEGRESVCSSSSSSHSRNKNVFASLSESQLVSKGSPRGCIGQGKRLKSCMSSCRWHPSPPSNCRSSCPKLPTLLTCLLHCSVQGRL